MAEGNVLVVACMTTVDRQARDEVLARLKPISDNAQTNEQGATKYAIFYPREDDDKTLWVVEEYTDMTAYNEHMASGLVTDINAWLQDPPKVSAGQLHLLQYLDQGFGFTRAEVKKDAAAKDPTYGLHVIFAELDYVEGGVGKATPYWKAVVDTGRDNEPGTLAYGIYKPNKVPEGEENKALKTFEVYESVEYLKDVHVPSDAISESIKNTKHLRTGLKHHLLRKVYGFLDK